MKFNLLKHTVVSCVSAVALTGNVAQAAAFLFDPDGTGPQAAVTIDKIDLAPSSVLAINGSQAIANFLNGTGSTEFQVLTQAKVVGLLNGVTNLTPAAMTGSTPTFELTVIAGFRENVTGAAFLGGTGIATFASNTNQPNFLEIYYDSTPDAQVISGTGYGADSNAQLIFSTEFLTSSGQFGSQQGTSSNLDVNGADDWAAANGGAGQKTISGTGSQADISLKVPPTTFDANFFPGLANFISGFLANISLNVPFVGQDPARQFYNAAGQAAPGYTVWDGAGGNTTLGTVNGAFVSAPCGAGTAVACRVSGPDFLFSTDTNITLSAQGVPEPATLALLGVGLAGFGASRRSKKLAA